jgi:hypothetical protein
MCNRTLLFLLGLLLVLSACSENAPLRDFSIEDLLIDPSEFPSSWRLVAVGIPPDQEERWASEANGFSLDTGLPELTGADLSIYRYKSIRSASSAYDKWEPRDFNSSSIAAQTSWEAPPELPYESPTADKSRFACHISSITKTTICQFMGQYEEFLVVFFTGFDGEHMTYADLEHILQAIDTRMAHYLSGQTPGG